MGGLSFRDSPHDRKRPPRPRLALVLAGGVDEALATFCSAADRCDEYPEFVFTRGESWLYEQVERIDPELFGRVRRLVEGGQWHVTGGQYIQIGRASCRERV